MDVSILIDNHIKRNISIPKHTIYSLLLHISTALSQLHSKNILHRDIKISNIFYTSENKFKIGDFGLSI